MTANLSKENVTQTFQEAKYWIKKNIPVFTIFVDEPKLEFVETDDGWDIRPFISLQKIVVNLKRIKWYFEREQVIKYCPKYDIETALIHDLFEYCYIRRWNYPEDDSAIIGLTHSKARALENALRKQKGLSDWI